MVMIKTIDFHTKEFFKGIKENSGYILVCCDAKGNHIEIPITTYDSVLKKSKEYRYLGIKNPSGNWYSKSILIPAII